jgi:hypothetical protein
VEKVEKEDGSRTVLDPLVEVEKEKGEKEKETEKKKEKKEKKLKRRRRRRKRGWLQNSLTTIVVPNKE